MTSKILSSLADDKFRAIAFAEYNERAQERYSKLINMMSSISDYVSERDGQGGATVDPLTDQEIWAIVDTILTDYEFAGRDIILPMNGGYPKLGDVLFLAVRNTDSAINFTKYNNIDVSGDDYKFGLPNYNAIGQVKTSLFVSIGDIGKQLQSNFHSIVCLASAARAYADKLTGKVNDAIARFNDKLSDIFTSAHADISNSLSYFKSLLVNSTSAQEFISSALKVSGIKDEAEAEPGALPTMDTSEVYKYTGASPSSALDFSAAGKLLGSTAKAVAGVVVGVAKGLWAAGKALFSKITSKLREVLIDPNDLQLINEDGENLIDGFYFKVHNRYTFYLILTETVENTQSLVNHLNAKYAGNWIATKTKFGEMLFKPVEFAYSAAGQITIEYDACFKPKVINYECLKSYLLNQTHSSMSDEKINNLLTELENAGSALYDLNNVSEGVAAVGLLSSIYMFNKCSYLGLRELNDGYIPQGVYDFDALLYLYARADLGNITNAWWLQAACGWDGGTFSTDVVDLALPLTTYGDWSSYSNVATGIRNQIEAIIDIISYEHLHPYEEIPFVPYSNNQTNFSDPSFRIKTDDQNTTAFNNFITAAIVIVIIAVVATTALIAIKKYNNAKFLKWTQVQGELDNKMWNADGSRAHPYLTKAEKRRYLRAKRKLDKMNLFSGSLNNAASALSPKSDVPMLDNDALEALKLSITG